MIKEVKLLSKLDHPHVVRYVGTDFEEYVFCSLGCRLLFTVRQQCTVRVHGVHARWFCGVAVDKVWVRLRCYVLRVVA